MLSRVKIGERHIGGMIVSPTPTLTATVLGTAGGKLDRHSGVLKLVDLWSIKIGGLVNKTFQDKWVSFPSVKEPLKILVLGSAIKF